MGDDVALKDDNIPPIQEELFRLYSQGYVTDITLTCEDGKIFEAHKVILSARSNYFYNLIPKLKGDPVIFLKGVKGTYLEKILKYVYSGTAAVPRTQLRSLFDVARSLQIKGLVELSQTEIGKGLPGAGCSKNLTLSPASNKSDPDSFRYNQSTREAREIALKQQQKLYDKFSSSNYKKPSGRGSQTEPSKTPTKRGKGSKEPENQDEESFTFKYEHISDDSDDVDNDDANDSDFYLQNKNGLGGGASGKYSSKKRRGRPPKPGSSRKVSKSSSEAESDSSDDTNDEPAKKDDFSNSSESDSESDNSDLDSEDSGSETKGSERTKKSYSHSKREPSPSLDDYLESPKRTYRRPLKGPEVNGQHVLTVQCKGKRAELHLARFCNGAKGKSVLYKNSWITPDDYEKACGSKSKKYLDSITTDYGPLKTLTVSGFLKPHARKCKCNLCNDEEPEISSKISKDSKDETSAKPTKNIPEQKSTDLTNKDFDSPQTKRRKVELSDNSSKHKLRTTEDTPVDPVTTPVSLTNEDQTKIKDNKDGLTPKPPPQIISPVKSQPGKIGEILSPPTLTTTKTTSALTTSLSGISTFSPSSASSLSPTFISLSSAGVPQINSKTSLGSSMIPFPSKLSGIPSPSGNSSNLQRPMQTSTHLGYTGTSNSIQTCSPNHQIQAVKQEMKMSQQQHVMKPQAPVHVSIPISQQQPSPYQVQKSRIGAVMQVRCKAIAAYLYVSKYESGSKGKCILLGDEWLTPNEFEEKSGSKAKKYLSSIKCLGRPLRAYVNSGELRGSNPPPTPKPQRMTKPKPPQAIAPAPGPSQLPGQLSMSQLGLSPQGMSPAHLSQSLTPVAMMGSVSMSGQPILINQSSFSVANSSMGNPILTPMTFTLAPMTNIDVRQSMQQQQHQQMHGGQHM